ncbi:VTT domain-containing protein [Methylomicrobium sp. Wu6]|uniref:TVP38/TMEM64 family protein n=1 Tax=Methylomicrobium sp. Wu6 TaxID=3107928 RepID=UPI002DD67CD2|nr:VTT domain-containing protein [Methylomicrobium sp. Wu6]MEC4748646.1 VTT domain-containing protein [Methylomicrobium sp. Wu6]
MAFISATASINLAGEIPMRASSYHLGKRLCFVIAFIGAVLFIGHELELYLPDLEIWVGKLGVFAPLGFIALFVVLSPFFVSVDALCFAAGLLFSLGAGELYVIIATYAAAAVIFFIGRYLLRERVFAFIKKHKLFSVLDALLVDNAFKLMLLLRLTPAPFALLSYTFSVTQVEFWPYLFSTSGVLVYNVSLVYFGYTAKHFAGLMSERLQPGSTSYPLLIIGMLLLLLLLIFAARTANKTLKRLNLDKSE